MLHNTWFIPTDSADAPKHVEHFRPVDSLSRATDIPHGTGHTYAELAAIYGGAHDERTYETLPSTEPVEF